MTLLDLLEEGERQYQDDTFHDADHDDIEYQRALNEPPMAFKPNLPGIGSLLALSSWDLRAFLRAPPEWWGVGGLFELIRDVCI